MWCVFFHLSHIYFLPFNHVPLAVCVFAGGDGNQANFLQHSSSAAVALTGGSFFNRIRRLGMSMWLRCMFSGRLCIIILLRPEYNARAYIIQRRGGGTQSLLSLKRPVNGCNFWKSCAAVWFALFDAEYWFFERLHA